MENEDNAEIDDNGNKYPLDDFDVWKGVATSNRGLLLGSGSTKDPSFVLTGVPGSESIYAEHTCSPYESVSNAIVIWVAMLADVKVMFGSADASMFGSADARNDCGKSVAKKRDMCGILLLEIVGNPWEIVNAQWENLWENI
ncbi:hypothetical protein Tco_0756448 [Tanacetum coccineum]